MSLGGPTYSVTGNALMQTVYGEGVLMIAAAGNDGTSDLHYPASYDNVLSVAAVDQNREWAAFSQYNSLVDISAPGVDILSTSPLNTGGVLFLSSSTFELALRLMKYSAVPSQAISGILVDCPNFGRQQCPGTGGHICLIER